MKVKSPRSNSETSCWSHFSQYKEIEGLVLLCDGSEVLVNLSLVQSLELGVVLGDDSHLDNMGVTRRKQYAKVDFTSISLGLKSADRMVDKQLIATCEY